MASAATDTASSAPARDGVIGAPVAPPRSFAGLTFPVVALLVVILGLLIWAGWTTRELLALKRHRIVSVSLSTLISDFVIAESRSGGSAEETSARTKFYIAATQSAMKQLSADGTTILVSEAVMSNSVPDYTPVIKAAVDKAMKGASSAGR
jgi:hypothetical protein